MKLWERIRRSGDINPFPITDKVTFRNVDETLTLCVRSDAPSIVLGIKKVLEKISGLSDASTAKEKKDAAMLYAKTLFGEEQAKQLWDFYGDALPVIAACGMYFNSQLSKKITKAQKK